MLDEKKNKISEVNMVRFGSKSGSKTQPVWQTEVVTGAELVDSMYKILLYL